MHTNDSSWKIAFLVMALTAAVLGFTALATTPAGLAEALFILTQALFAVFPILFVASLVRRHRRAHWRRALTGR